MTTRTPTRSGGKYTAESPHSHFLFYDIETVPAPDLPQGITDSIVERITRKEKDEEKATAKVEKRLDEFSLSPLTNRIVCIAFAFDDEKPRAVYGKNERDLLAKFIELVADGYDSIQRNFRQAGSIVPVTFNGLAFDQHILFMKVVQYGLDSPRFPLRVPKFDKGANHLDLRMILGNSDVRATGTLSQWATRLGFEGAPLEHDGSEIRELFNAGDFDAIREKCKTDVELVRFVHSKLRRYL